VYRHVADRAPVSVGEVAQEFTEREGLARTTILTVMERLRRKGYLKRRKSAGLYRYSPAIPKKEVVRSLVRDFAERVLGGSSQPFVAYLAEDAELSDAEVEQLTDLARTLKQRRKGGSR
jgi:predicted transcriptional regulator